MRHFLIATASFLVIGLIMPAHAQSHHQLGEAEIQQVKTGGGADKSLKRIGGRADVSKAALATAVLDADGLPLGAEAYDTPVDAVKAGDMAAFLGAVRKAHLENEGAGANEVSAFLLALDAVADNDDDGARQILEAAREGEHDDGMFAFLEAWMLALEGKTDEALEKHREASGKLPGLTSDLSLAAMLDATGRQEQALAVYEFLTPARIDAPDHEFDPQTIVYSHVQLVVSRHALLLQRMGRIDEAKAVYARLAEAEPENAASFAAAIESLETGEGLDNDALSVRRAFVRSLSDLSRAVQQARIIRNALVGVRVTGFDDQRAAMDQVALLIEPEDADLRESVIDQLYAEALYDGVTHVANNAPEPTAGLQLAAAQAYLMQDNADGAKRAMAKALDLVDDDNRFETLLGAVQLYVFLDNEEGATSSVETLLDISHNDAERAVTHGIASGVYQHFEDFDRALSEAQKALALDNTHDRRIVMANALADAGKVDEGLKIIRDEHLSRANDPYMLNNLGYYLVTRTDRFDEGFRVLSRANALAPSDAYIADSLGWAYYKLGDLKGAERLIKQSRHELAPHTHWEIEDHLGDIYWHEGKEDKAREAWQVALETRPPYKERALIQSKLDEGLKTKAPEKRPLPKVSLDKDEVGERDI